MEKISGPSSFIIVSPNEVVTEIKNLTQGVYAFKLEVIDSANLISSDIMLITVSAGINQPPIMNAGPDLLIFFPKDSVQGKWDRN